MTHTRPNNGRASYGYWSWVLILISVACGGGTSSQVADDAEAAAIADAEPGRFVVRQEEPGHLSLAGPTSILTVGDFVELVPRGPWPTADETRPAQALLRVTGVSQSGAAVVPIAQRSSYLHLDEVVGRVVVTPTLAYSKSITTVLSRDGRNVRLSARGPEGVFPGDYFFVLGAAVAEPERLGSHIVALLQVQEVTPAGSTAQVVHQSADFASGDLAIFAHHASLQAERPEALILFAQTDPDGARDPLALPPLARAVIDYQAEYRFSNIRIETLDQWIDPAAYNAPDLAEELAPEEGFGVIVFGRERDDGEEFLYNITTYGTSPSLSTNVGILPGGLPLPTPEGLEGLSDDLAPSFLATAMTQRGDHAEVIYFLESVLRSRSIAPSVAFHLREHLALRYESIGRPYESLWLMTHDITVARQQDNPYAELNALSIREYLHRSQANYEAELGDLDTFLAVSEDVLPDESLLSERLERARTLSRIDRLDEALDVVEDVIRQAQGQQSLNWELSAGIARADMLFRQGRSDEAISAMNALLPDARVQGESYPRYVHVLLAQYFTEMDDEAQALLNAQAALAYAADDESPYLLASTHELVATINFNFDNLPEAVANMTEAVRIYSERHHFEDSARGLLQLGLLELNTVAATADPRYIESAYDHLSKSAEAYMAVADGRSAAQAYGGMGMVNFILRDAPRSSANYGRAVDLASAYNDPETVATAWERLAELQHSMGHIEQAQIALQNARLWASTFDLLHLVDEIDSLERELRNEI